MVEQKYKSNTNKKLIKILGHLIKLRKKTINNTLIMVSNASSNKNDGSTHKWKLIIVQNVRSKIKLNTNNNYY